MRTSSMLARILLLGLIPFTLAASAAAQNPDDVAWSAAFGPNGMSTVVRAVAIDGSNVYAGGDFTTAGSVVVNRIARWNGTSWAALGGGVSNSVYAIAMDGTSVYVGGTFTTAGGKQAFRVARWNGSTWSALGGGLSSDVFTIAVGPSGNVYVGGRFTTAGGMAANRVAMWNGSTWSALGSGLSSDVFAIAVDASENVYVGGAFTTAGGLIANRVARWDGTSWSSLAGGMSSEVFALAVDGSSVYAGGTFTVAGGTPASRIARWNGSAWSALGSGLSNTVRGLAVDAGDVYAAGDFTTAGGNQAFRVARWSGTWSGLGSGLGSVARAVAASSRNAYVGGDFTTAGGKSSFYFAHWDEILTAILIEAFAVRAKSDGVQVSWDVFADEEITGFRIDRRVAGTATAEPLTGGTLLPPRTRSFVDASAQPGRTYEYRLAAVRPDGSAVTSRWASARITRPAIVLNQNSPNPFNPVTTIRFSLPEASHATLTIYDTLGRRVVTLLDRFVSAGPGSVVWNGRNDRGETVGSGVYFYELAAGTDRLRKKMILLK